MKLINTIFTTSIFFIGSILSFSQSVDLKGSWEATDEEPIIINFEEGSYISFGYRDEVKGGKSFDVDGVTYDMKYHLKKSDDGLMDLILITLHNTITQESEDVLSFKYTYNQNGILNLCPIEDLNDCKDFKRKMEE